MLGYSYQKSHLLYLQQCSFFSAIQRYATLIWICWAPSLHRLKCQIKCKNTMQDPKLFPWKAFTFWNSALHCLVHLALWLVSSNRLFFHRHNDANMCINVEHLYVNDDCRYISVLCLLFSTILPRFMNQFNCVPRVIFSLLVYLETFPYFSVREWGTNLPKKDSRCLQRYSVHPFQRVSFSITTDIRTSTSP